MQSIDLEKRIPRQNLYRFYRMAILPSLFGEWSLEREWGRIGTRGRMRLDWYKTNTETSTDMDDLLAFKTSKGYTTRPVQLSLF